jgi:hypothetical protein
MITKQMTIMGFKGRSLPNLKNFKRYLDAYMILASIFFAYNFINIMLFRDDLLITFPTIFLIGIPIILVTTYGQIESEYKTIINYDVGIIVMYIALNYTQSLVETLDERPELLGHKYKKKSLLDWAIFYNNKEAHNLIVQRISFQASNVKMALPK